MSGSVCGSLQTTGKHEFWVQECKSNYYDYIFLADSAFRIGGGTSWWEKSLWLAAQLKRISAQEEKQKWGKQANE